MFTDLRHKPSDQIVEESRAVDHLDDEAVGDDVKRLREVFRYFFGSARGLALIEARNHPCRDWEQGRGSGMPQFVAMLGGASGQRLHDGREDEPLQYLHCWEEQ